MKLIGIELNKQDDEGDQWLVTYRYQAGSEKEALVHAQRVMQNGIEEIEYPLQTLDNEKRLN